MIQNLQKICRIKLQCSFTHKKRKKSKVRQERKITAHAIRCLNALLTCQFHYMITNVAIDNGYPLLSTNHELSYHEQNTAN